MQHQYHASDVSSGPLYLTEKSALLLVIFGDNDARLAQDNNKNATNPTCYNRIYCDSCAHQSQSHVTN